MTEDSETNMHRQMYPEQYEHSLVGRHVIVAPRGEILASGLVERVVNTRFGLLVIITDDQEGRAWSIKDCEIINSKGEL